jgi:hypothetical protein
MRKIKRKIEKKIKELKIMEEERMWEDTRK